MEIQRLRKRSRGEEDEEVEEVPQKVRVHAHCQLPTHHASAPDASIHPAEEMQHIRCTFHFDRIHNEGAHFPGEAGMCTVLPSLTAWCHQENVHLVAVWDVMLLTPCLVVFDCRASLAWAMLV